MQAYLPSPVSPNPFRTKVAPGPPLNSLFGTSSTGTPFRGATTGGGSLFSSPSSSTFAASPGSFSAPFSTQGQQGSTFPTSTSAFGQATTFGSNTFGFGAQGPFGAQASGAGSTFGAPANQNLFGSPGGTPQTGQGFGTQPFGNVTSQFGAPQQGFGAAQPGFGTTQQPFGAAQSGFGTTQSGFGTTQSGFGTTQPGFGTTQSGFGTTQSGFGTTQQPFGASQQTFGTTQQGFGTTQAGFGTTQQGFGTGQQQTFGIGQQGFGSTQQGFGTGQQGFGSAQQGFGTTQQSFGVTQPGFGTGQQGFLGQQGFGTGQQGFGTAQQGFGGTGQQTFGTTFGSSGTGAQTGVGFGNPAQTNFQFSAPTSTSSTFQTTQASVTPFGSSLVPSTGISFGIGTGTQPQQGFSFTPVSSIPFAISGATSITTASSGITFGTSLTSASVKPAVSTLANTFMSRPILKPAITSTTTTTATATTKAATNLGGGEVPPPSKVGKENLLPAQLLECVNVFKNFVKSQKNYSSEVARASLQPIKKVSEDIEMTKHLFTKVETNVIRNKNLNKKVKSDTIRGLSDCEIAQSTTELHGNFQVNYAAPYEFFSQLCERFQEHVTSLRLQVEDTEKHITCVLNPSAFTPQELSVSLQRLHESFVALAGRMQNLHSLLIGVKKQQRFIQKKKVTWSSDVFDSSPMTNSGRLNSSPLPGPSPTPFSGANNYHVINMWAMKAKQEQINALSKFPIPPVFGTSPIIPASVPFGMNMNQPVVSSPSFPLKPPPSNKRGKR